VTSSERNHDSSRTYALATNAPLTNR